MTLGSIAIIAYSAAFFLAFTLWLAADQKHMEKWTGWAFAVAIAGGLCIYGSINASLYAGDALVAILHTVVDMGGMFGNNGDGSYENYLELIKNCSPTVMTWYKLIYWIIHFFAYYSLISAIILFLGKDVILMFKKLIMHVNDIELIYGVDENTVEFGSRLSSDKFVSLVFVGEGDVTENSIRQIGGLWYTDADALEPKASFLKSLGLKKGKRRIRISAISKDGNANIRYAKKMLECLKQRGVDPSQTELVMFGLEETEGRGLQASGAEYGYGSVRAFERFELVARLLTRTYPLCEAIEFDKNALAKEDMEVLLVGFGSRGQAVLRKLVANGQFEGSHFHVMIFDPKADDIDGLFALRYEALLKEYDIDISANDGRSKAFYSYLKEKAAKLRYIVVAVGDERVGTEIAGDIADTLKAEGYPRPVYQCLGDRVLKHTAGEASEAVGILDSEILYHGRMDELSMQINHYYCGEDGRIDEQWRNCDYFSRMSCRASADYLSAYLERTCGEDGISIAPEKLENLAKTEHRRWNAFHFSMGYAPMSEEVFKERKALFKKDRKTRITKDADRKLHACLVGWDELDALSERENRITGKNIDYKKMDRDNIEVIRKMIADAGEKKKEPGAKKAEIIDFRGIRRYAIPAALILVGIAAGTILMLFGRKSDKDIKIPPAGVLGNAEDAVISAAEDVSWQEARSLFGDADSQRFVPSDEPVPESYPCSYDHPELLKALNEVYPPTRDQSPYGTCWAHQAVGLAELYMINQGYADKSIDLSEMHLVYYSLNNGSALAAGDTGDRIEFKPEKNAATILDNGGSARLAVSDLAKRRGMTDEHFVPYSRAKEALDRGLKKESEFRHGVEVKNALFLSLNDNALQVKQAIMEGGGAGMNMEVPEKYSDVYDAGNFCFYNPGGRNPNHAVIAVGWDDNYPKENFKEGARPEHDGAWLVRNSWSTASDMGIVSYFWISYDERSLSKSGAFILEVKPQESDKIQNVYCYDQQAVSPELSPNGLKDGMNVYVAGREGGSDTEVLKTVGFYVYGMGRKHAEYEIKLRKHLGGKEEASEIELSLAKGQVYYEGFYTVDLEEPIRLKRGEKFSVEVCLDRGGIAMEGSRQFGQVQMSTVVNPGESFFKKSDGSWKDMADRMNSKNLLIYAYTEDE